LQVSNAKHAIAPRGLGDVEPAIPVTNLAQRNYQRWRQVQDEIYRTLMNAGRAGGRGELAEDEKSGVSYSHAHE
jgi:hypothetical protein